jgi:pantoate--beta-alanine ligase
MGALHAGHISLIKSARQNSDVVISSIFVNPTQFNDPKDFEKYPKTEAEDCKMLEEAGCDVVFAPEAPEMYPQYPSLKIDFGRLEQILEGEFRPGHFNGVGIVVSKLFNIIKPNRAYFGQKDIQQCAVVNRLVKDLNFDLELIICDTVREPNGLAMSSRNRRLSSDGFEKAAFLFQTLQKGKELIIRGSTVFDVKKEIYNSFKNNKDFRLEYYEIVDFESLEKIDIIDPNKKTAIVVAAFLEEVRLIDNLVF